MTRLLNRVLTVSGAVLRHELGNLLVSYLERHLAAAPGRARQRSQAPGLGRASVARRSILPLLALGRLRAQVVEPTACLNGAYNGSIFKTAL